MREMGCDWTVISNAFANSNFACNATTEEPIDSIKTHEAVASDIYSEKISIEGQPNRSTLCHARPMIL